MEKNNCCFSLRGYNKVCWMIESHCNLNCPFCYHNQFKPKNRNLNTKNNEYLKLISAIQKANIKHVILSGGEPLLSCDLFNIISLLEEHGFTISICTNATLATPEFCNRLKHTSVKKLTVNLATICDDSGRIVKNNNSVHAINGICNLTASGFIITLNNILRTSTTKESIIQNIEHGSEWGAKTISFTVPVCKYSCETYESDYYLNDQIVNKLQTYLEEIEREIEPKINIEFQYPDCNFDGCPANKEIWGISSEGILSTCLVKQYQAQ